MEPSVNIVEQRSPSGMPRGLMISACLVVVIWGLRAGEDFFVPLLLSAMLAFMGAPLVRLLLRAKVPHWVAVSITSVALVTPIVLVAAGVVHQLQLLIADYPHLMSLVNQKLSALSSLPWARHLGFHNGVTVDGLSKLLATRAGEGLQIAMAAATVLASATSHFVLVILFSVTMLATREHLYRCGKSLLAQWEGVHASKMLAAGSELIEQFLLTRVVVAAVVGVASGLSLWGLGIEYGFLLGAIVGVLTMLPEVGFLVSLVPILLVAFLTGASLSATTGAMAAMMIIHLIEANILTPRYVGKTLNLNALATFVGLFAGGLLWGVWGMFLSVPILGIMRIVFSVSPRLAPWGDLLAQRDGREMAATLVTSRLRATLARAPRLKSWRKKDPAATGQEVVKVRRRGDFSLIVAANLKDPTMKNLARAFAVGLLCASSPAFAGNCGNLFAKLNGWFDAGSNIRVVSTFTHDENKVEYTRGYLNRPDDGIGFLDAPSVRYFNDGSANEGPFSSSTSDHVTLKLVIAAGNDAAQIRYEIDGYPEQTGYYFGQCTSSMMVFTTNAGDVLAVSFRESN